MKSVVRYRFPKYRAIMHNRWHANPRGLQLDPWTLSLAPVVVPKVPKSDASINFAPFNPLLMVLFHMTLGYTSDLVFSYKGVVILHFWAVRWVDNPYPNKALNSYLYLIKFEDCSYIDMDCCGTSWKVSYPCCNLSYDMIWFAIAMIMHMNYS